MQIFKINFIQVKFRRVSEQILFRGDFLSIHNLINLWLSDACNIVILPHQRGTFLPHLLPLILVELSFNVVTLKPIFALKFSHKMDIFPYAIQRLVYSIS